MMIGQNPRIVRQRVLVFADLEMMTFDSSDGEMGFGKKPLFFEGKPYHWYFLEIHRNIFENTKCEVKLRNFQSHYNVKLKLDL